MEGTQSLHILNKESDSVIEVKTNMLEGIRSVPLFYKDYPAMYTKMIKDSAVKQVSFSNLIYSPSGDQAVVDIRSNDNKDPVSYTHLDVYKRQEIKISVR